MVMETNILELSLKPKKNMYVQFFVAILYAAHFKLT